MPGPVIQGHAKIEEQCDKCHERFVKSGQVKLCLACHKDTGADIARKTRLHGRLEDSTCSKCHTDHKGREATIAALDQKSFDHAKTGLALKGAHQKLIKEKCAACHAPKTKYRAAPVACDDCHRKADVHKGELGAKCADCHNEENWKQARFDHDKTHFRLEGEHADTPCKDCHKPGPYKGAPRDCYSCHKSDDLEDGHQGRFNKPCEKCHSIEAWDDVIFNHERDTPYRLKGKHEHTKCKLCHSTTLYVLPKAPTKCVACHRKNDDEKGHRGSLGDKCESCHHEQDWKRANFDHDRDSDYRLIGKHKEAKCEACHKNGLKPLPGEKNRQKAPTKCDACHKKIDDEKGHKGKFGEKCETCHSTYEWKNSNFEHDVDTKYALKGKHRETKCVDCHPGVLYGAKLSVECISCHRKLENDKGHKEQLGTRCNDCHDEKKWAGPIYDHNKSRFALTGKHRLVDCKKCHASVAFKDARRACLACHGKEDVHKRRLGIRCETCHNSRTWKSWDFDHGKTKYPLMGAHTKPRCEACHKMPVQGTLVLASACASCHQEQDVHRGGFGAQCERCHGDLSWKAIRR